MKKILLTALLHCGLIYLAPAQHMETLAKKENISFRGLETFGDDCVWVSGSGGTVGKSLDAGKTWTWVSPKGYEKLDFRDIEVFSKKEAIILSAGSPGVILRTTDGGESWQKVYEDNNPTIFFDGMDFQGKEGFVVGDPIDGAFQLLQSKDRGKTWKDVSNFMFLIADSAEAAFAASGTSIQYIKNTVLVGTGGSNANLFKRNERKLTMDKLPCPIMQGEASQGVFSIDFLNEQVGVAVGGDYMRDTLTENTVMLTTDGGLNWSSSQSSTSGFKSAVKYINKQVLVTTGTSGTDISTDAGQHWTNISKESFNSIGKTKSGKVVYLAGSKGNIAKLIL